MLRIAWGLVGLAVMLAVGQRSWGQTSVAQRPNILWITSEDNGPQLGCYGDAYAYTPNIDALASGGQIYLNAWSNAPVCAPARTAIITGMYPTSLGAQHMRSQVRLPKEFLLLPEYFAQQGYYTSNNAKEDYNLVKDHKVWDASSTSAHWRRRAPGQPFFAVFNFTTTHESQIRKRPHVQIHDPQQVSLPPYHPDLPEVREDWAQYYDQLSEMDGQVGRVLDQLRQDELDDNTIIFYFGDHGCGLPRGKRWLYQSGLHVPLIVVVPPRYQHLAGELYQAGSRSDRLVSFVDLAPTMLSLIGIRPPEHLQGEAFLGAHAAEPHQYNYGFRDRMDERYDMSRAVRDERYLYIRNFFPQRPQGTYLSYMFETPTTQVWKAEFDAGRLDPAQSFFWQPKPAEELYDLQADPHQITNLAQDAAHAQPLERLRAELRDWMIRVCDTGLLPEGEMLARAGQSAPYTMAHDSQKFPAAELFDAADLASRLGEGELELLAEKRTAQDAGVRFWAANGFLVRAAAGTERDAAVKAARSMLGDPSPYVRCLVNETLARYGSEVDRVPAIHALVSLADANRNGVFAALMALNSLDWCEPKRSEVGQGLAGLESSDNKIEPRYQGNLARVIQRLEATTGP